MKSYIQRKIGWLFSDIRSTACVHGIAVAAFYTIFRFPYVRKFLALLGWHQMLVPVEILGRRMYINLLDPGISRQLLVAGTRERAHVTQIQDALQPGDNGIELGANIGFFTLIESAATAPHGHTWCIEPVAGNLNMLRRTIQVNGLSGRTGIFRYLIGDMVGSGRIQISEASNSNTVSTQHASGGSEEVPMVTLDAFMHEHGIEPSAVTYLRMDIEGYEVKALAGMKRLMESNTPLKLFIEFHPHAYPEWGWTFEQFLRNLQDYGFRIRQTAKEGERGSDGSETTIVLDNPTIEQLLESHLLWRPGGIQAFLERRLS